MKTKTDRIAVRLTKQLRDRYKKAAKQSKQSLSSVVVATLEKNEPVTN